MTPKLTRGGYVFLVSAIVIGSIAVVSTVSLLILGWAAEQNGQTHVKTNQALELANTCLDRAIVTLRENPAYRGGNEYSFPYGTCKIYAMEGTGNSRGVCVEGTVDGVLRRLEVRLAAIFPQVAVSAWDDVSCCNLNTTPGQCEGVSSESSESSSSSAPASESSSSAPASSSSSSAPGSDGSSSGGTDE